MSPLILSLSVFLLPPQPPLPPPLPGKLIVGLVTPDARAEGRPGQSYMSAIISHTHPLLYCRHFTRCPFARVDCLTCALCTCAGADCNASDPEW